MKNFDEKTIQDEYKMRYPLYLSLGEIIQKRLNEILKQGDVNFDYVQMRVKGFSSFYDKIFRYNLTDPFKDIEDFCGLRIIHLFDDDLLQIINIIKMEFNEIKTIDKTFQNRDPKEHREKEFSYRSYHIFVTLKNNLLKNNIILKDFIAEIQIRTICMHSWASIEHQLNYKKKNDYPNHFRPVIIRKFSQMSAVLEIADDFFVSLRKEKLKIINAYKHGLSKSIKKEKILDEKLNIDLLQAYLENNFSTYKQENDRIIYLLDEMNTCNLNLRDIEKGKNLLLDKNLIKKIKTEYPTEYGIPTQTGLVRLILDITNKQFHSMRKKKPLDYKWLKFVDSIKSMY